MSKGHRLSKSGNWFGLHSSERGNKETQLADVLSPLSKKKTGRAYVALARAHSEKFVYWLLNCCRAMANNTCLEGTYELHLIYTAKLRIMSLITSSLKRGGYSLSFTSFSLNYLPPMNRSDVRLFSLSFSPLWLWSMGTESLKLNGPSRTTKTMSLRRSVLGRPRTREKWNLTWAGKIQRWVKVLKLKGMDDRKL